LGGVVIALAFATNSPAETVTNFSNFSESGNLLLPPTYTREQTYTPGGTSVTITSITDTTTVGQETYLTDEFPTLTAGYRITVDLTSATFRGSSAETIGLVVASTETPNTQPDKRGNLLIWGWRNGSMWVGNFDGSSPTAVYGNNTSAYPSGVKPDSVFIERTATGWTLGSIKGAVETNHFTNLTTVAASTITANGTAFGLYSDMRNNASTWTVGNLTLSSPEPPPPPPPTPNYLPLVSFVPVSDGNEATNENGYAGSAINSIAFAQNNLITIGGQQFITYYRRHGTDPGHPSNNTVVVARRNVGELLWEIFPTNFTSFNINDTHNVISMAIDGDGVMHMSWGMHVNTLLYARSTGSVLGGDPIVMTSLGTAGMTGQESSVTYPKFQTLPDGDVIFLFREGGSGNGDWYLNRYDTVTDSWLPVHTTGTGLPQPLMLGLGDSPNNCFYPDRITLGPDGMLHLAGVFRYGLDIRQTTATSICVRPMAAPHGSDPMAVRSPCPWLKPIGSWILVPPMSLKSSRISPRATAS
jgi:BNR repeat-containing family member